MISAAYQLVEVHYDLACAALAGLSDGERQDAAAMPKVGGADSIEFWMRRGASDERTLVLPPGAATAVAAVIDGLLRGERVAVLTENQDFIPSL